MDTFCQHDLGLRARGDLVSAGFAVEVIDRPRSVVIIARDAHDLFSVEAPTADRAMLGLVVALGL